MEIDIPRRRSAKLNSWDRKAHFLFIFGNNNNTEDNIPAFSRFGQAA